MSAPAFEAPEQAQRDWPRVALLATTLALAAVLLFARLGHYALWDDEAYTALGARAILETGDTSAVVGHNVVADRHGTMLLGLKDRATPPLPKFLVLPFLAAFGPSAGIMRLPFALAGFATIAVLLERLRRSRLPTPALAIFCVAVLGNVSLFLYDRQCRYYALAGLTSLIATLVYLAPRRSKPMLAAAAVALLTLLLSNPMNFVALLACLGGTYLLFGRKHSRISLRSAAAMLLPALLIGGPLILLVWNPFRTGMAAQLHGKSWLDAGEIFLVSLRDVSAAEFAPGLLLLAVPFIAWWRRDGLMGRGFGWSVLYIAIVAVTSPQLIEQFDPPMPRPPPFAITADIRYLVPLIPLLIVLSAGAWWMLFERAGRWRWVGVVLAVPMFGTNIGGRIPALDWTSFRSTPLAYLGELRHPPADPYTAAIDYLRVNVPEGATVWATPFYTPYPLMFHAPHAVYGWQLFADQRAKWPTLPAIQFEGVEPPEYIVAFGPPGLEQSTQPSLFPSTFTYRLVASLPVFHKDLYRPELFWRTFETVPCDVEHGKGVYVFKREVLRRESPVRRNEFRL